MKGITLSHSEIGAILGCSRETVRRIERTAMRKLREAMGSRYRGSYTIYDSEGVAEMKNESNVRSASGRRRSRGRFV